MNVFKRLRIYVASSWANPYYADIVASLAAAGHEIFDWRSSQFRWEQIDPDYERWSNARYVAALRERAAWTQFKRDIAAIEESDVVVLALPAGGSAHSEAAWAAAKNKQVVVFLGKGARPEVLHNLFHGFVATIPDLVRILSTMAAGNPRAGDMTQIEGYERGW
jgi:hypothetical protein